MIPDNKENIELSYSFKGLFYMYMFILIPSMIDGLIRHGVITWFDILFPCLPFTFFIFFGGLIILLIKKLYIKDEKK